MLSVSKLQIRNEKFLAHHANKEKFTPNSNHFANINELMVFSLLSSLLLSLLYYRKDAETMSKSKIVSNKIHFANGSLKMQLCLLVKMCSFVFLSLCLFLTSLTLWSLKIIYSIWYLFLRNNTHKIVPRESSSK